MDAALWERGRALFLAKLEEQRAAGVLEEVPAVRDDPSWRSHKPPTIHKRAQADGPMRHGSPGDELRRLHQL